MYSKTIKREGSQFLSASNSTDDGVLGLEFLLPVIEDADLLIGQSIKRGNDVVLLFAHLGECAAGILAGEHAVRPARSVEGFTGGNVKDSAPDRHVYRLGWIGSIVLFELLWSELHGFLAFGFGERQMG